MSPTKEEHKDVLEEIKNKINQIGDEIVQEIRNDEDELEGYRCTRADHHYIAYSSANNRKEYVNITYPYNLLMDYSKALTVQQHEGTKEELKNKEINMKGGKDKIIEIAENNPQEYEDLRRNMIERLCTPYASHIIHHEEGVIMAFKVTKKLFPYENDLKLSEYHNSVQTVIGIGVPAKKHLQSLYGITPQSYATKPKDDVEEADNPRYFG